MQQWWLKFRQMENRVLDFFVKHNILIIIAIATVLALVVRLKFRQFESGDFIVFLQPWFDELRAGGGLPAISKLYGRLQYALRDNSRFANLSSLFGTDINQASFNSF